MRKFLYQFSCLLLICGALPALANGTPTRIEAKYDILKAGIRAATVTETYTRNQNSYRIESVSKAVGLVALFKPETITVISTGIVTAKGLRPHSFSNRRKLDTARNSDADFNWTSKRITLKDSAGMRSVPLPRGTQDRLSAMYQFMFVPLSKATALDFNMTNGSKLDIYNYLIASKQSVTVPLGTFDALYVSSTPKAGESRTEIWLATKHANFPYKMVITDPDGGKLMQVLTKFELVP